MFGYVPPSLPKIHPASVLWPGDSVQLRPHFPIDPLTGFPKSPWLDQHFRPYDAQKKPVLTTRSRLARNESVGVCLFGLLYEVFLVLVCALDCSGIFSRL